MPTGVAMSDGDTASLASGFPHATSQQLLQQRHKIGYDLGGHGGYQAIMRWPKGVLSWGQRVAQGWADGGGLSLVMHTAQATVTCEDRYTS